MTFLQAFLAGLYLQAGVGYVLPQSAALEDYRYDVSLVENPQGVFAIGWETNPNPIALQLNLNHISGTAAQNDGQNMLEIALRWHPWAAE